ncbi:MAG TPA: thiolase domain-containing protein [Anaerolineales bacterium]|nr:thiolase domain-containing protein [Anaerolineae bacterium]HIQ01238.1 thiolase domain-containing protein [Anaerolineales bacterium]
MRDVAIIGIGQTKVGEHWEKGLRHLALEALQAAMVDAGVDRVDTLYVGNMLSGELTGQEHLGALVADFAGMRGVEAVKVEAACGSGAAALRLGYIAVAGGMADVVLVVGVEKMTDATGPQNTAALAMAADADYEAAQGLSFVAINGLLMRRYMYEYGYRKEDFAPFTVNAHANAMNNPYAMFRVRVTPGSYTRARMIADPINLMDSSPIGDGAAAVILVPADWARRFPQPPVRIAGSAVGTDAVALHDRRDPLVMEGAALSAYRAYQQAGVGPEEIDLFELHDAFSIMAALSLEAAGFARRGEGVRLALEGKIGIQGRVPVATMGGLKARGHPVGATGVYQVVEVVQQLRGEAGANQVPDARIGMAQNIGGSGATVITHILERME